MKFKLKLEFSNIFSELCVLTLLVGRQEGHPACKKNWDGGGGHWLVQMEWRPAGWSVCLPLLIFSCTIKSRSSLLAMAHPGGPGKKGRLCVCVSVCVCVLLIINDVFLGLPALKLMVTIFVSN